MVLIETVHPDQHQRSTAISTHMCSGFRFLKTAPFLARLGYVRLAGLFSSWGKEGGRRSRQRKRSFHPTDTLRQHVMNSLRWKTFAPRFALRETWRICL